MEKNIKPGMVALSVPALGRRELVPEGHWPCIIGEPQVPTLTQKLKWRDR